MSKHARLTSWVISSHDWASPAGTLSLSQREPRTARARALKTSVPLRRELPSEQATSLVRRQRQPAEQILARRVPPRARAPPVLAPRVRLSLREQRRDGRGMFRCVGQDDRARKRKEAGILPRVVKCNRPPKRHIKRARVRPQRALRPRVGTADPR